MLQPRPTILLLSVVLAVAGGCSALPRSDSSDKLALPRPAADEERPSLVSQDSLAGSTQNVAKASAFPERRQTSRPDPAAATPISRLPVRQGTMPAPPASGNQVPPGAGMSADLKAFICELDKSPDLDPEIRYEIVTWISQTPRQYQPQLIRQYRALLAMGTTLPAGATARPSVSDSSSAAEPAPAGPMDTADSPAAVARETEGTVVATAYRSPPAAKTRSDADLVDALAGLIAQSRAKAEGGGLAASATAGDDGPGQGMAWRAHVDAAIEEYQRQRRERGDTEATTEDEARLRLLYLIADRRDDACRPIASLDPKMQEFWSRELFGLATLMSDDWIADRSNRLVESKRCLSEALMRLGESTALFVRNLAFVTEVQSYGCYTPFPKYEFSPGQKVLLYAEVDNYQSKETARGHHTSLRSGYEIFDHRRQKVAEHQFETNEEYCRNSRRDFFTVCEFAIPEQLDPGKYELRLTVADLNGDKAGQSSITFHVPDRPMAAK